MRGKILSLAVSLGRRIGSLGIKVRSWIEFKEWKYWALIQGKSIDLPQNRSISVRYDRKGSFIDVSFWQWVTQPNGEKELASIREPVKITFESIGKGELKAVERTV